MLNFFLKFFISVAKSVLIWIGFLIYPYFETEAQNSIPAEYGIELKTHYGFLMAHHTYMRILQEQHFPILQLNFFKKGNFGKEWQSMYHFPQYGVSLIYSPLSSPKYLGKGIAVVPFMNFRIFTHEKVSFKFFVGSGIGYIEKPFNIRENYKNEAIGSRFNAVLAGQADFRYKITPSAEISSGLSITHFSNGKHKTPNLGINNLAVYFGIAKYLPSNKSYKQPEILEESKRWEKNFFFALSSKQNYPVGGNNYLYTAYSFNVKRFIGRKSKFGIGTDIFYDFSDRAHFRSVGFNKPDLTYIKPALYILHDFRIGKVSLFIHVGTYLYTFENNQDYGMIYDRAGIQYYFNKYLSTHIALKTHYARADCIELAINLSF